MTNSNECRHFDSCSAPLCPLDSSSLGGGLWYPDEEICRVRKFQQEQWLKNQKKLKKVGNLDSGYFTKEMLDRRLIVRKGIKGIDPDKDESRQLKRWLSEHPDRKPSQKQLSHFKNMAEAGHLRKRTG